MRTYVKHDPAAPSSFFAAEAHGLQWLSSVLGGARCARVVGFDNTGLTLEHIDTTRPSARAAHEFGRRLACTHAAGAPNFGAPPALWDGPGFFGPLQQPLPMSFTHCDTWGCFYAEHRLQPMLELAHPGLDAPTVRTVEQVMTRCAAAEYDDGEAASRIHGDLWNGNVLWTDSGAVLIDPAAHGGHRETDLAMLHLFGCPYLADVLDGYQEVHPLRAGWQRRIPLHQLYPLLAHVVVFGGGYARQVMQAARSTLEIS